MSGHSKWATTHRQKETTDKQRSKFFTKAVREIITAVKCGGGPDPNTNSRLRLAIQNAKEFNMPKENIDRAINKSINDTNNYSSVIYEGTWEKGVQLIISCLTDNQNRTVADIRNVLKTHGGTLVKNNSLMFNFEHKSVFVVDKDSIKDDKDDFLLNNIDNGFEDVFEIDNNKYEIIASVNDFLKVQTALESQKIQIEHGELQYIPIELVTLDDSVLKKANELISDLESLDDVKNVTYNF